MNNSDLRQVKDLPFRGNFNPQKAPKPKSSPNNSHVPRTKSHRNNAWNEYPTQHSNYTPSRPKIRPPKYNLIQINHNSILHRKYMRRHSRMPSNPDLHQLLFLSAHNNPPPRQYPQQYHPYEYTHNNHINKPQSHQY